MLAQYMKSEEFPAFHTKYKKNRIFKDKEFEEINVVNTIIETTTSVLYDLVISCGSFFFEINC